MRTPSRLATSSSTRAPSTTARRPEPDYSLGPAPLEAAFLQNCNGGPHVRALDAQFPILAPVGEDQHTGAFFEYRSEQFTRGYLPRDGRPVVRDIDRGKRRQGVSHIAENRGRRERRFERPPRHLQID